VSERDRGRAARDELARRIKDQAERDRKPVTWDQARDRATDVARQTDRDLDRRR
jgi:hypothetical protein